MRRHVFVTAALVALTVPALGFAQDARDLLVKTFRLRNLRPDDAAKLLGPYVTAPGGGVFEAGSIGAITVRETSSVLVMIDSLLRVHDRPRSVVSMRFQLIAALDSARSDPAIGNVDAELRKLFKFQGYELIGEATMVTEEQSEFVTTLSTKVRTIGTERYSEQFQIGGWLESVSGSGDDRTVRVTIRLHDVRSKEGVELLRTGLTLRAGQTIVLGSARPTGTMGSRGALILVMQPEITTR